ncbi:MAG: hypothetical protein AAB373_05300 [Patescibacteria group bacterium]
MTNRKFIYTLIGVLLLLGGMVLAAYSVAKYQTTLGTSIFIAIMSLISFILGGFILKKRKIDGNP